MKSLPFSLSRFIDDDRVIHLGQWRDTARAHLAEAKALVSNKHLADWKDESRLYVSIVEKQLAAVEARVSKFDELLPQLERAANGEAAAVAELTRANEARGFGSADRKEALRLRDDVEAAEQAVRVHTRTRTALALQVNSLLPNGVPGMTPGGREMVQRIATFVDAQAWSRATKGSNGYLPIPEDTWKGWLAFTDADMAELPFWIAKIAGEAEESTVGKILTTFGLVEDRQRVHRKLPVGEFLDEMRRFKNERAALARRKVDDAKRALEAAQAAVDAAGGAQ